MLLESFIGNSILFNFGRRDEECIDCPVEYIILYKRNGFNYNINIALLSNSSHFMLYSVIDEICIRVYTCVNIYIHARPCVRVRARTRYYRATIIILPFHAFWLGRHHGRRRIAIFEFPSWSIHRADHLLGLMPRIYGTLPLSLSLSLSLFVRLYSSVSLSLCIFYFDYQFW